MQIKELMDSYYEWLKNETAVNVREENYYEITAPFLDNSNDYIQFYAILTKDGITLTDEGYYVAMLEAYGIPIEKQRLNTIDNICRNNGVKLENKKITVSFSLSESSKKLPIYQEYIHKMIQSILRVDDMHLTSRGRVKSFFNDDVIEFLDANEIGYTPDISVVGKSGLMNTYELLFQKNKTNPERFGKIINNLNKQSLTNTIFIWHDTQESRKSKSELIVFANDDNKMDEEALVGFENYGVKIIPWSAREDSVYLLQ